MEKHRTPQQHPKNQQQQDVNFDHRWTFNYAGIGRKFVSNITINIYGYMESYWGNLLDVTTEEEIRFRWVGEEE